LRPIFILILVLINSISTIANGQAPDSSSTQEDYFFFKYEIADINPEPINGYEEIFQFISKELDVSKLPQLDTLNCDGRNSCKVFVEFIINEKGIAENYKIIKGIGPIYDSLVLEVVKKQPVTWKPGVLDGKVVRTKTGLPITIRPN